MVGRLAAERRRQTLMEALGIAQRKTKQVIVPDCIAGSRLVAVYARVLVLLEPQQKAQVVARLERVYLNLTVADIALVVVAVHWHSWDVPPSGAVAVGAVVDASLPSFPPEGDGSAHREFAPPSPSVW